MVYEGTSARVRARGRRVVLGPDEHEREEILLGFGKKVKTLRTTAELTQEELAVRAFMSRDEISCYERGARVPSMLAVLMLESRLGASRGSLTEGLAAPTRRAGTAQMLELVTRAPGLSMNAATASLELPLWYTSQLALYLQSIGAISSGPAGWVPADKQRQSGRK
jgi:transcriptional regulator with XRE-family HTH domain